MFWVYYPEARQLLAKYSVFNPKNDAQQLSWEDVMEMRFFSSYIIKESNVYDRRIQDYAVGLDALYEGERIKDQIQEFEHDLWSY
jgi:gliding motility associated protien GldN